ncbi:type II secretion system F family protein [Pseudomonadota bacterium AL_CKDN230030165-1A_HGKHYDSX7]
MLAGALLRLWRVWPAARRPVPIELPRWCRLSWRLWSRLTDIFERWLTWQARHRLRGAMLRAGISADVPEALLVAFMVAAAICTFALVMSGQVAFNALTTPLPPSMPLVQTAAESGTGVAGVSQAVLVGVLSGVIAGVWPLLWLWQRGTQLRRRADHDLPFLLDLMVLCVEAGLSLNGALRLMYDHAPKGVLRNGLSAALADMRAGVPRQQALEGMAAHLGAPGVRAWVGALVQAERLGASVGPVLRGLSAQQRADSFQRAEEAAMQAPVKMLLPLMACIFPCTFIVLAFPIVRQLLPLLQ